MGLADALQTAIDACVGAVDPAPLQHALAEVHAPWRVAVIGRVSAGKSSLVNWLVGRQAQPVGLGGITERSTEVEHEGVVWVDTPGIDDPDRAVVTLGPLLEGVDAAIWVVDGLQPMTRSERDVVAVTLMPGTPLRVVVSRADLLEADDAGAVVARCAALADVHDPVAIRAIDLRSAARDRLEPGPLTAHGRPGPRRARIVEQAVDAVSEALASVPAPPDLGSLLSTWTQAVREVAGTVERDITRGRIHHKTDALAALAERSPVVRQAIQARLGVSVAPRLPDPDPPISTALGQVLAGMSGAEGARRVLKAGAARWMAEGQLVLSDWWADETRLQQAAAARAHLEQALDAVRAELRSQDARAR